MPGLSPDGTRADLKFEIREGRQTIVDHILIVGNTRTETQVITRELLLQEGKPLGLEDLIESQRRLGALGLFRRIRIDPVVHAGGGGNADVLVTVEEASTTTVSYGGGLEVSRLLRAGPDGAARGAPRVCAARVLRRRTAEHRREEPFSQSVYAG